MTTAAGSDSDAMDWLPNTRDDEFEQLCVWPGTILKLKEVDEFTEFVLEELGARSKVVGCVVTGPGDGGPGGRTDLFFLVHSEDIEKFAVRRLKLGMRWWEDVDTSIYPEEFRKAYRKKW